MKFLHNFSLDELKAEFKEKGIPLFRAKQVYEWATAYAPYENMTNLPLAMREQLKELGCDEGALNFYKEFYVQPN